MDVTDLFDGKAPVLPRSGKHGVNHAIRARVMHIGEYNEEKFDWEAPFMLMQKLNGVYAMWCDGALWTKDGKQFPQHVVESLGLVRTPNAIIGELYAHGLPLQKIAGAVALNSYAANEDLGKIWFHAFDYDDGKMQYAVDRYDQLGTALCAQMNVQAKVKRVGSCVIFDDTQFAARLDNLRAQNAEGAVLYKTHGIYVGGETQEILKLKFWKDGEFKIIGMELGEGKASDCMGTLLVDFHGLELSVGTFQIDYPERKQWWEDRKKLQGRYVKIKWITLSEKGLPQNASLVQLMEEGWTPR